MPIPLDHASNNNRYCYQHRFLQPLVQRSLEQNIQSLDPDNREFIFMNIAEHNSPPCTHHNILRHQLLSKTRRNTAQVIAESI